MVTKKGKENGQQKVEPKEPLAESLSRWDGEGGSTLPDEEHDNVKKAMLNKTRFN